MAFRFPLAAVLALTFLAALPCHAASENPRARESVVFGHPEPEEALEAIVIESQRDPEDRRRRAKSPTQQFSEALKNAAPAPGLSRLADGSECFRASRGGHAMCVKSGNDAPAMMDRFTPHGAATEFRAGSSEFGH